ncbi:MAG: GTPase/DUF3482 domain-containing protein [Gammaproteobacteria bacterium]|nr:GTPase/DUF3482 domain-containing protein [Gammaproteobacteria bacterium]
MIPVFAVVGHPNKGKSSIVATLAEDEEIVIGPAPGTTRRSHRYTFSIDSEPQYVLVDTPGFQRAGAVLEWLEARAAGAHERPRIVEDFVNTHLGDGRFHDECELLKPMLDGAGILYVVDGAKPYGPEYELEMQVLQWTGRPRMALINLIGSGDYVDDWRQALDQYFSLVRVFDAVHADFAKRVALLRGFGELDESWRPGIERAVMALEGERLRRLERSAVEIANYLIETMSLTERTALGESEDVGRCEIRLMERLQNSLRERERLSRETVQSVYRHQSLTRDEAITELLATDLFTEEGWELFGLSRMQLMVSGLLSGALAGGGIDAILGGASFMLGAGLGALVGGVGAWFGSEKLAKTEILGQSLGGRVLQVGPVKAANFPWVMLGRAWIHHQLVAERNHARREAMSLAVAGEQHLMDRLPDELRRGLGKLFKGVSRGHVDAAVRQTLANRVAEVLRLGVSGN